MAGFVAGTTDPSLTPDPGAGPWNSSPITAEAVLKKEAIVNIVLPVADTVVGDDAAKHLRHYMGNSGAEFTIDLVGMINEVPSAKFNYDAELAEAAQYIETLPLGTHMFASSRIERDREKSLYNRKSESWNWFFAIGGYSAWGKGKVEIKSEAGVRVYRLTFEYKFFDRYNWDGGKKVTLFGVEITDEAMGEFHRQGLAQEFNCRGALVKRYSWRTGQSPKEESTPAPAPALTPVGPKPPVTPPKPQLDKPLPPEPVKPAPPPVGQKIHVVKTGDSLSKLAKQYYGSAKAWPRIYDMNKGLIGKNPNLIYPGQRLKIP